MKFLKGFGVAILGIIIAAIVFALSISFILKNVLQKQIASVAVKEVVTNEYMNDTDLTDEEKEKLNNIDKMIGNKDISKLISIIMKEYEESIDKEDYSVSENSLDEIINLCVKYIDVINDFSHERVTESDIRSNETRNELREAFNETLEDIDEEDELSVRMIVKSYNLFTSTFFRIVLICVVILFTALIGLIKSSYYKWLRPVGIAVITSGVFVTLIYVGAKVGTKLLEDTNEFKIAFKFEEILLIGIIEIVLGIGMIITNGILNSKFSNKEENNNV